VGTSEDPGHDPISELSSLDDPVRRRLYEYVGARDGPVAREDAAAATGISRTLAAYHLDKLADAGLLATSYARPAGRSGPGAGRPAKRYVRARRELTVSVPPRDYALLAGVLAEAVAADRSGAAREAAAEAAHAAGEAAGGPDLMTALRTCGYEPAEITEGCVELRNCPFHRLADRHTELVCGLNLHLMRGLLAASGEPPGRAVLAPRPGRCCVVLDTSDGYPGSQPRDGCAAAASDPVAE
jgi:predicted ArsR family transcriptional regulator